MGKTTAKDGRRGNPKLLAVGEQEVTIWSGNVTASGRLRLQNVVYAPRACARHLG